MSETNVTEIKSLEGHPLADEKARAGIAALAEEIEEIKNANDSIVEHSGDFFTFEADAGIEVDATSTYKHPHPGSSRWAGDLYLHHIRGCNLFDWVEVFGGVGTTEINGVTFEVCADSTLRVSGTATGDAHFGHTNLFNVPGVAVPPGTYCIGNGLTLAFNSMSAAGTMLIKQTGGVITLNEPASLTQAYVYFSPGAKVDTTVQLALVRGNTVPSAGLAYDGETYLVASYSMIDTNAGEVDWNNGTATFPEGYATEYFDPVRITTKKGTNTFFTICGTTTVRYEEQRATSAPLVDHELFGLPVLKLYGDTSAMTKDNSVALEYNYNGTVGTCDVKWQGSSSLGWPKKNYTIKFDNKFEAADGWGEQKKYCFKANFIDHSHARNVVSAKLWGQVVKSRATENANLSGLVNGGAIDGFPCVIILNDEFHGLFTWNIPKDGWMMGMSDPLLQQAIICADGNAPGTHFTGAATLDGDFDLEYISDEGVQAWLLPSLNRCINAVANSDGSDLDTTVAQYLDWDSAIDYFIFTGLLGGSDMIDKNYLLATHDGVKWFFSAYDMDTTYGLEWDGKRFLSAIGRVTFEQMSARQRVMLLIWAFKKDALIARYKELRAGVMSEDNVTLAFGNFGVGLPSVLLMEDAKKWPTIPSTSQSNTAQIVNWYRIRCAEMDKTLGLSGDEATSNYTNQVSTAQAPVSDAVYNVLGYKDGVALSNSSPYETSNNAVTTTGLMPYPVPTVGAPATIYIKGDVTIDANSSVQFQLWKNGKTSPVACTDYAGLTTYYYNVEQIANGYYKMSPILNGNGRSNIVDNMGTGYEWIRLTLSGSGVGLIVTFDEPIA